MSKLQIDISNRTTQYANLTPKDMFMHGVRGPFMVIHEVGDDGLC